MHSMSTCMCIHVHACIYYMLLFVCLYMHITYMYIHIHVYIIYLLLVWACTCVYFIDSFFVYRNFTSNNIYFGVKVCQRQILILINSLSVRCLTPFSLCPMQVSRYSVPRWSNWFIRTFRWPLPGQMWLW